MLRIVQDEDLRLEGRYWIDGELTNGGGVKLQDGRIDLTNRKWAYYQDYEAALRGFDEPASGSTQMQSSAS